MYAREIACVFIFVKITICMKLKMKTLRTLIVAMSALVLGACADPEPIVVYGLTLSQTGVVFDAEGGESLLEVAPFPEEEEWSVDAQQLPAWVGVEVVPEGVKVSVVANLSTNVRTAQFSLLSPKGNFESYEISVSQEAAEDGAEGFVTSAAESYTFDSEGGEYRFTVVSDSECTIAGDAEWLTVEYDQLSGVVTLSAEPNEGEESLAATLTIVYEKDGESQSMEIAVEQQTRAENAYYKLVGRWLISASKWFYSPNGSLNSLDYDPNPADYYLIFDIEEGEYGKTLVMKNFLYPYTSLEVRYDATTGGFVIPFGWTVYSYNVFFYITLVGERQFSYASAEVDVTPSEDGTMLIPDLPTVSGYNWVGFGLWTYDDEDNKIALGSNFRPTMFPMGDITFRKYEEQ